ncbi:MAG TPA: zf-HC2 domain-containing protein [Vicinamibacterales bacterium]|jgi:hypothetical protein
MNCEGFDRALDALLDGACDPADWQRAEAHATACPRCARLFEGLSGRGDGLDEDAEASLVDAVMARTSGSACESARERLCDYVDGSLEAFDRELVAGHVARCAPCAELAEVLARTAQVLPSLAELTPPASLMRDVLSNTSRHRVEPSFGERLMAWLMRAAQRPRFPYEVAYVCTLLLILIVGDPMRAIQNMSARGAFYLEPRAEAAVRTIGGPLAAARSAGARTVAAVAQAPAAGVEIRRNLSTALAAWWDTRIQAPFRTMAGQVTAWAQAMIDAFGQFVERIRKPSAPKTTPAAGAAPNLREARHV